MKFEEKHIWALLTNLFSIKPAETESGEFIKNIMEEKRQNLDADINRGNIDYFSYIEICFGIGDSNWNDI